MDFFYPFHPTYFTMFGGYITSVFYRSFSESRNGTYNYHGILDIDLEPSNVSNIPLKFQKWNEPKWPAINTIWYLSSKNTIEQWCSGPLEFIAALISVWLRGWRSTRINFRELSNRIDFPRQRAYFTMIVGKGAWKPLQLKPIVFRKSSLVYVQWPAFCKRPGKVHCTWIGQRVACYPRWECSSHCLPTWWLSHQLRNMFIKWDVFPKLWTY